MEIQTPNPARAAGVAYVSRDSIDPPEPLAYEEALGIAQAFLAALSKRGNAGSWWGTACPKRCTMSNIRRSAVAVVLVGLAAATPSGHAETPTEENFRACNTEAEVAVKSGMASPTTKDHQRAEAARKAQTAPAETGARGSVPQPLDPQLIGMEPEKAVDAAYQAAYRSCMRRSGF